MRRGGTPRLAGPLWRFQAHGARGTPKQSADPAYLSTRWQFPEFRQAETSEHDVWMSMIIETRAGVLIGLCEDLRIRHGHGIVQRNLAHVCTEAHRLFPKRREYFMLVGAPHVGWQLDRQRTESSRQRLHGGVWIVYRHTLSGASHEQRSS